MSMRLPDEGTPAPARAVLTDGQVVVIRRLGPQDVDKTVRLHAELPERDLQLRFFTTHPVGLERLFARLLGSDDVHHLALGGFLDDRMVGTAQFEVLQDPAEAEVALAVDHRRQAHGLGTLLLEHLASAARERGVHRFVAEVLVQNAAMIQVLRDAGFPTSMRADGGTYEVGIELVPGYLPAVGERERRADIASLRALLRPRSVAVIGASRRTGAIGHAVLANLRAAGFSGTVYPVNPRAAEIAGIATLASARDLPAGVDLAVLCVPAAAVPEAAEACGRRGVRALLVISAGLSDHPDHAEALRDAVHRHGMRLVGPNCLGVINTDPQVRLNATFARGPLPTGGIGVVTQSGGVGIALLDQLAEVGLGVSTLVSTGDKYDVSSNDLLLWWQRDDATDVAVVYVESFGNPRKFAKLARAVSEQKPVLAVRTASTQVAQRAAASHTAALATPAVVTEALFGQAGVIPVDSLSELVGLAAALSWQPLPTGNRVGVIGNVGGIGVLAADACARQGLTLPDLAESTRAALRALLPVTASVDNPVDATGGVTDATFHRCVRKVAADPGVDAILVLAAPTAVSDPVHGLADAMSPAAAEEPTTPVLVVRVGQVAATAALVPGRAGGRPVPAYGDPALAAHVLAGTVRYGRWRARPPGTVPDLPDIDIIAARDLVRRCLLAHPEGGWLDAADAHALLGHFGPPVVRAAPAADADAAVEAYGRLGPAVAMKAVVPGLQHKSRAGGVLLDLRDPEQVRLGYDQLRKRFGDELDAVLIQSMAVPGRELLVGIHHDPTFGPLVAFGLGGVDADLIDDRAYRLVPLTHLDAAEMLGALRSSTVVFGPDAQQRLAEPAIVDVLLRVARMAELLPDLAELDLNPIVATATGCHTVDARIRVAPADPTDPYLRRLRT